jgi:hypothetical protein
MHITIPFFDEEINDTSCPGMAAYRNETEKNVTRDIKIKINFL